MIQHILNTNTDTHDSPPLPGSIVLELYIKSPKTPTAFRVIAEDLEEEGHTRSSYMTEALVSLVPTSPSDIDNNSEHPKTKVNIELIPVSYVLERGHALVLRLLPLHREEFQGEGVSSLGRQEVLDLVLNERAGLSQIILPCDDMNFGLDLKEEVGEPVMDSDDLVNRFDEL